MNTNTKIASSVNDAYLDMISIDNTSWTEDFDIEEYLNYDIFAFLDESKQTDYGQASRWNDMAKLNVERSS